MNIMAGEVFDIGVPREKPEKLVDDAFEEDFSRGYQREAFRQVKAQLRPKDAPGAGSRPVTPKDAVIEYVPQKIQVLLHKVSQATGWGRGMDCVKPPSRRQIFA
jgi:hypothetical protein